MKAMKHLPGSRVRRSLTILLLVASVTIAGCAEEGLPAEFEEALDAPGPSYTPEQVQGETQFRVKLTQPQDPQNAAWGQNPIVFALYDEGPHPIEDATITLRSLHYPGEHPSSGERNPVPQGHGLYRGETAHFIEGQWKVELNGTRANGDSFRLLIEYNVA